MLLASDATGPHPWVGDNDYSPGEKVNRDGRGENNVSPIARVLRGTVRGGRSKRVVRSLPLIFLYCPLVLL